MIWWSAGVSNPTDNDIISVRREAEQKAIRNGAAPGSVEVTVEVDTQRNVIRAIAVGATELRSRTAAPKKLTEDKLLELAAENLSMDPKALHIAARSENMCAVTADKVEKKLFGLMKKTSHPLRLIDEEGVIRLQKANATVRQADISSWRDAVAYMLEELTVYNDGGTNYPNVYIVLGKRIIDLSGMSSEEQIYSLANVELNGYDAKTPVIVAATPAHRFLTNQRRLPCRLMHCLFPAVIWRKKSFPTTRAAPASRRQTAPASWMPHGKKAAPRQGCLCTKRWQCRLFAVCKANGLTVVERDIDFVSGNQRYFSDYVAGKNCVTPLSQIGGPVGAAEQNDPHGSGEPDPQP